MKKTGILCLICAAVMLLSACADNGSSQEELQRPEAVETEEISFAPSETGNAGDTPEPGGENQQFYPFTELGDIEFYFSSGAGGWRTCLCINPDGSFSGDYTDSDMGDNAEEYPRGTLYLCSFSGSFTAPEKLSDSVFRFRINELSCENPEGEELSGGMRLIYTGPYGLEDAEDIYLYLPGTELEGLPQDFLNWTGYANPELTGDTVLPFWGLYNENAAAGFSGYAPVKPGGAYGEALAFADSAETETAELKAALNGEALSQAEMNQLSYQIFECWDSCLNSVWGVLKENLPEEDMKKLTEEELQWIAERDAAADKAAEDVRGGTLEALYRSSEEAEFTRQRVYELLSYLQ